MLLKPGPVELRAFQHEAERAGFEASRGQLCWYCLEAPAIERDHFRPKSVGGREGDNLIPACRTCNARKGGGLISEWLPRLFSEKVGS